MQFSNENGLYDLHLGDNINRFVYVRSFCNVIQTKPTQINQNC